MTKIAYTDLTEAQRLIFDAMPPHIDDRHDVDCGHSCEKCNYLRDSDRRLREATVYPEFDFKRHTTNPGELEAYRELEAAVRELEAAVRELESRAANVAMPMIRDRIRAALAALDRARR